MGLNGPRSPDGGYRPSEEPDHVPLDPMWSGLGDVERITHFDPEVLRRSLTTLQGVMDDARDGDGSLADVQGLGAQATGAPAGSPFGQPGQSTVFRNMAQAHEDVVQEFGRRYQDLTTALSQAVAGMAESANILDAAEQATTDSVRQVASMVDGPDPAAPPPPRSPAPPPSDTQVNSAGGGSFESGGGA